MHSKAFSAVLLLAALATSRGLSADPNQSPRQQAISEVASLLAKMPKWPLGAPRDEKAEKWAAGQVSQIRQSCHRISRHDVNIIREGAREFQDTAHGLERWKIHLLNKYLFNIPEAVSWESKHYRQLRTYGIAGAPFHSETIPGRWPWYRDEAGEYQFSFEGRFFCHQGPEPDFLREFDYLELEFGARNEDLDTTGLRLFGE